MQILLRALFTHSLPSTPSTFPAIPIDRIHQSNPILQPHQQIHPRGFPIPAQSPSLLQQSTQSAQRRLPPTMSFQAVNTGQGLSPHDNIQIPIRANTEHHTYFMSPTHSSVLPPAESLVQRTFHIYSEVEKQLENENPWTFLHLFYNSNNPESKSIDLGDELDARTSGEQNDGESTDSASTLSKPRTTYFSELNNIMKSAAKQHQEVEGQLRELLNQFNRTTGDLGYVIERLLEKQFVLKKSPGDLLSDFTTGGAQQQGEDNEARFKPTWITPFLPSNAIQEEAPVGPREDHYSAYNIDNRQIDNAQTAQTFTIKDFISPPLSTLTEEQYKLALMRIIIIKRKIQLIKSNHSLQFFTKLHKERLLQSTQLFHDLQRITTYFPITLPTYKTHHINHASVQLNQTSQQQQQIAQNRPQKSQQNTTNVYSLPLPNAIMNGLHTQHFAHFLSQSQHKPQLNHYNPLYTLFDPKTHQTEYQFVSRILTDSMKAKSLTNSIFFNKNILLQNTTLFSHLSTPDQQFSTTPYQIMQSFYKNQIAQQFNLFSNQSPSNLTQSPLTSHLRQLFIQFDPQFAQSASYKQSPSHIFHPRQYSKKTQIVRGDYGIIYTQNQSLSQTRAALNKTYGVVEAVSSGDKNQSNAGEMNDGQSNSQTASKPRDFNALLTNYDSFTQTMDDIIDTQHWKAILGGLQRHQQQVITQSLLHRLILEANLYQNGNVINFSAQSGPTTVDYAVTIDKDKLLTKQVHEKIKMLQHDYETERRALTQQLNIIREGKGKFDDELHTLQQQSQQKQQQQQQQQQQKNQKGTISKETSVLHEEKLVEEKILKLQTNYERDSGLLQSHLKELSQLQVAPPTLGSTYSTQWTMLPDVLLKNELDRIEISFKSHTVGPEKLDHNNPFHFQLTDSNSTQNSIFPSALVQSSKSLPDPNEVITETTTTSNIHQGFKIFITGQLTFLEEQQCTFTRSIQLYDLVDPHHHPPHFPTQSHSNIPQHYLYNEISRIFLLMHYLYFLQYSQTVTVLNSLPLLHKLNIPYYSQFYLRTPNMIQIRLSDTLNHPPQSLLVPSTQTQSGSHGSQFDGSLALTIASVQKDALSGPQLKEQELLHDSLSMQYLLHQQTRQQSQQSYFGTQFANSISQYATNALTNFPSVVSIIPQSPSFCTQSSPSKSLDSTPTIVTNTNCHFFATTPQTATNLHSNSIHTSNSMDSLSSPNMLNLQASPHSFLHIFITFMKNISNTQILHNKVQSLRAKVLLPWNSAQQAAPFVTTTNVLQVPASSSSSSSSHSLSPLLPHHRSNPFSSRKLQPHLKLVNPTPINSTQLAAHQRTLIKPKIFITFAETTSSLPLRSLFSSQSSVSPQSTSHSYISHTHHSIDLNVNISLPCGTNVTSTLCTVSCTGGVIILKTYTSVLFLSQKLSTLAQILSNSAQAAYTSDLLAILSGSSDERSILTESIISTPLQLISILHDSIKQIMIIGKQL